jgi:SEFIR domain
MTDEKEIRVFISYTHDSDKHKQRVLALAQQLRPEGPTCEIDRYVKGTPAEGWPLWMERQIASSDFVLVVCTETYLRRYNGEEEPGVGLGGIFEAVLTRQHLLKLQGKNLKFVPVLFEGSSPEEIPTSLQPSTHYRLPEQYEDLLRYLTDQPEVIPAPVGKIRSLPPIQNNSHLSHDPEDELPVKEEADTPEKRAAELHRVAVTPRPKITHITGGRSSHILRSGFIVQNHGGCTFTIEEVAVRAYLTGTFIQGAVKHGIAQSVLESNIEFFPPRKFTPMALVSVGQSSQNFSYQVVDTAAVRQQLQAAGIQNATHRLPEGWATIEVTVTVRSPADYVIKATADLPAES